MKIEEVLAITSVDEQIKKLQSQRVFEKPDIETYKKQYDPEKHSIITDTVTRPDKNIKNEEGQVVSIEKPARIALSLQKLIVKRATAFLFGNPVKITSNAKNDDKVLFAINRIHSDNKVNSFNRQLARVLFATTEVAELWYPVKSEGFKGYGFDSKFKMRCRILSPLNGDILYPFYDDTGDMAAFSREFSIKDGDGKDVKYFETWTNEKHYLWKQDNGTWSIATTDQDGNPINGEAVTVGKIPVIYAHQEEVEWNDVQWLIERLEKLISNFADTNDYHASPKIFVTGEIKGWSKKGEAGAIIEGDENAEAKYLAWPQAPEAVKLEIENLMRLIFSLTQTPDISFEAVKGMGNAASGNSLELLFLDAHLKVQDKREIFDDYLQRRLNLLKAFVSKLNTGLEKTAQELELTAEITPYMVNDYKDAIDNLVSAVNGGILSKKTAIGLNPLVKDADAEVTLVESDDAAAASNPAALDNLMNNNNQN